MRTSEKPLTEKLPPSLVAGEQGLLQPLGTARRPRGVPLEPHGLQPTAPAQSVQREEPRLGKRARGPEQPRPPDVSRQQVGSHGTGSFLPS